MSTDETTAPSERKTIWASSNVASAYKSTGIERVTGSFALPLLQQAGVLLSPPSDGLVILDNACGTGVLTATLMAELATKETKPVKLEVVCGDFSEGMIASAEARIKEEGWEGVSAKVVDAQDTNLPSQYFTHVLTNFGVLFFPNSSAALSECHRILKPQGVIGFTTWKSLPWVHYILTAVSRVPSAPPVPTIQQFMDPVGSGAWYDPTFVRSQLVSHGFDEDSIKVEVVSRKLPIESAEKFVAGFGKGPPMQTVMKEWTEEQKKELTPLVETKLLEVLEEMYGQGKPFEAELVAILSTASKA